MQTLPKISLFLGFLRNYKYADAKWDITLGDLPTDTRRKKFTLYGSPVKLAHLAATTSGYISSHVVPDFWIVWGGDLAAKLYEEINNKMTGVPEIYTPLKDLAGNPTQELVNYTIMAFAKYIFSNLK